jgi:hypothetical protein
MHLDMVDCTSLQQQLGSSGISDQALTIPTPPAYSCMHALWFGSFELREGVTALCITSPTALGISRDTRKCVATHPALGPSGVTRCAYGYDMDRGKRLRPAPFASPFSILAAGCRLRPAAALRCLRDSRSQLELWEDPGDGLS